MGRGRQARQGTRAGRARQAASGERGRQGIDLTWHGMAWHGRRTGQVLDRCRRGGGCPKWSRSTAALRCRPRGWGWNMYPVLGTLHSLGDSCASSMSVPATHATLTLPSTSDAPESTQVLGRQAVVWGSRGECGCLCGPNLECGCK